MKCLTPLCYGIICACMLSILFCVYKANEILYYAIFVYYKCFICYYFLFSLIDMYILYYFGALYMSRINALNWIIYIIVVVIIIYCYFITSIILLLLKIILAPYNFAFN